MEKVPKKISLLHRVFYLFRYLRNVTIRGGTGKPDIKFLPDGTLEQVELKIMNLRPGLWSNLVWEEVTKILEKFQHFFSSIILYILDWSLAELQEGKQWARH